jgi:preprotein translocase subunit SecE
MALTKYLKDTRGELKHVSWPTTTQTVAFTILVIAISLAMAVYLGALDSVFTTGLDMALNATQGESATPIIDVTPVETTGGDTETPVEFTVEPVTE